MAKRFEKLNRAAMRALAPGQNLMEHGIRYTKLLDGDGRFSIDIQVDGRKIHRVIGRESEGVTREKAEQAIEKIRTDAREDRLNLPKGRKIALKFGQAAEKYIERLKESDGKDIVKKAERLKLHLTPYFTGKALSQISNFEVERYKKYRKDEEAQPATVNRELAVLSHLLNQAIEWGWIPHLPCKIKLIREDNARLIYLTTEQCARLLEAAKHDTNPQIYMFVLIGLETAMRRSEILSIKLRDINLDQRHIYLPVAKAGARVQPITENLAEFLESYLQALPADQEWLFPSLGNMPSKVGHTTAIEEPFRRVVEAANLDPTQITPHTLRHTATSQLMQAGVDVSTIQAITGHKTPAMVHRYSHQNSAHIREAMDKLQARYQSAKSAKSDTTPQELRTTPKSKNSQNPESGSESLISIEKKWYPLLDKFRKSLYELPSSFEIMLGSTLITQPMFFS